MRLTTWLLAGVACLSSAAGAAAQETDVDLELVLAVDVSRSMDPSRAGPAEAGLHRGAAAPRCAGGDPCRLSRPGSPSPTRSGRAPERTVSVAPWTLIDGPESAAGFAPGSRQSQVSFLHGTSISGGLLFASGLFEKSGFRSARQVIDVSGDGPNNMGLPVLQARAVVLERGITINGLPIMIHADYVGGFSISNLDDYYEDCVIGGPGAFLLTVESIDRIAEAIRRKLVLEIAGASPRIIPVADVPASANRAWTARSAKSSGADGWIRRSGASLDDERGGNASGAWPLAFGDTPCVGERSGLLARLIGSALQGPDLGERLEEPAFRRWVSPPRPASISPSPLSAGAMRSATNSPIFAEPGTAATGMRGIAAAAARRPSFPPSSVPSPAIRCRSRVASATTAADCSGDSAAI